MMRKVILVVFLLPGLSAYCQQTIDKTCIHNGITREYRLYIPPTYTGSEPVPLIFNLHGYTSNNLQQELYSNFKPIADTANFIICLPNGTFDALNNRFWNAGFGGSVDDIGFLMALLDTLLTQYHIDPSRVYCTGMSNGGFMSFALACAKADRIAAIASVTGGMTTSLCQSCVPSRAVPVLQIHGTADPTVPYSGNAQFLSIDSLIAFWVRHNECNSLPIVNPLPDISTTDGCTATQYVYANCNDNAEVVLYKIDGGGHTWPGSPITIGPTNRDFNASEAIWQFFKKHLHPDYLQSDAPLLHYEIRIFPNPFHNQLYIITNQSNGHLSIYDANGKLFQHHYVNHSTAVDLSDLPAGMYWVFITNHSTHKIQKVVKY